MDGKEYLEHVGILGMKWGHRKNKSSSSTTVKVIRTSNSEDHDRKLMLKTKKLNQMSNAELKALNERMQLERQYKDLSKADISRGKKIVQDMMNSISKAAQDAAIDFVKKQATKNIENIIKKNVKG